MWNEGGVSEGGVKEEGAWGLRLQGASAVRWLCEGRCIHTKVTRLDATPPRPCTQAFARTEQLDVGDKLANALRLGTSPIVRALVDFDGGMDM